MKNERAFRERLVCSPCCLPRVPRTELYALYRELGFSNYEGFCSWCVAHHDFRGDPKFARDEAADFGLRITSFHLPQINDDIDAGLEECLTAARFASQLSERPAVLFKAVNREIFAKATQPFLNALEREDIQVVPVVQNHKGTAISSLDDYREVLEFTNDSRLHGVLEVGHFARVGTPWQDGWNLLEGRLGLIHINEIKDGESVHFGTGTVDFSGLFTRIKASDYPGNIVVELELPNRDVEISPTIDGLRDTLDLLADIWAAA